MTISVKVLAEPASFTAELVVQCLDQSGNVVAETVRPLTPGYTAGDYIHSGQQLVVRERKQ